MATNMDLQVNVDNMWRYIVDATLLRTRLRMLHDELEKGSKSIYPEAMEARVCFQEDTIKE